MIKKLVLTAMIVLATLTLTACSPRVTSLSSEKAEAYAAKVDETVENLIAGFGENDYAKFSRDFEKKYSENFETGNQEIFAQNSVVGAYLGKTLDHVETRFLKRVVVYHLAFENEPDVYFEVYFMIHDPHKIVGLYWMYPD